jgi:hypothetical protein
LPYLYCGLPSLILLMELHNNILSTSRKGLNMVNLVLTKETKANVQAHCQDYPNNPI